MIEETTNKREKHGAGRQTKILGLERIISRTKHNEKMSGARKQCENRRSSNQDKQYTRSQTQSEEQLRQD